jgi:hypothetical protein
LDVDRDFVDLGTTDRPFVKDDGSGGEDDGEEEGLFGFFFTRFT